MLSFYSVALIFLIYVSIIAFLLKQITDNIFKRKKTGKYNITGCLQIKNVIQAEKRELLLFNNVGFSYNSKTKSLLKNINFVLDKTMVLTGESGTGKTTLAKLACGLLKPKSGEIKIPENPYLHFQEDIFLEHCDCAGNVMLALKWKKTDKAAEKAFKIL